MKLLVLSLNFPPEMGATATRLFELTSRLAAMGHEVRVITAMPNYPTGRVLKDYRWKLRVIEEIEKIQVTRTWIYPSKSSYMLPRFWSHLSFILSGLLLGTWRIGRQDVVLFDSPPLLLVPFGLVIGRITKARTIMNVSDIWPRAAVQLGYPIGRCSLQILSLLERFGYKWSDVVSTTCPGAMEQIRKRFPQVETTVISSGVDLDIFRPSLKSPEVRATFGAGEDDFIVGYFGLHGLFQGLKVVVEAASRLRDHPRIKFIMVGDGPTKKSLMDLAKRRQLNNLTFKMPVTRADVAIMLASCDAALIPLAKELPETMPSKVYEILASGIPVIISGGCEGATLVRRHNTGRIFPPLDADSLANIITDLANHPQELMQIKKNCLDLARRFDLKNTILQVEAILMAVAEGRPLSEVEKQTIV